MTRGTSLGRAPEVRRCLHFLSVDLSEMMSWQGASLLFCLVRSDCVLLLCSLHRGASHLGPKAGWPWDMFCHQERKSNRDSNCSQFRHVVTSHWMSALRLPTLPR